MRIERSVIAGSLSTSDGASLYHQQISSRATLEKSKFQWAAISALSGLRDDTSLRVIESTQKGIWPDIESDSDSFLSVFVVVSIIARPEQIGISLNAYASDRQIA